MIKDRLHKEILLWNGKCEILDVIPSPPVYFVPNRCSLRCGNVGSYRVRIKSY